MLGVRLTLHHEWDRVWMRDGTADWFWPARRRRLGIPVMLNAPFSHKEIGEVASAATRVCASSLITWARRLPRRTTHWGLKSKVHRQFGGASECARQADAR